jgi:2-iminobutanoate/2-iminopropanoate deaminase
MNKSLYIVCMVASLIFNACTTSNKISGDVFEKEFIHPQNGYSQMVAVTTGNIKTLYISGQVGQGNDLEAQMRSVLDNLRIELKACGADFKDIVKMNTYIVDYKEEHLSLFRSIRKEILGDTDMPASTLVGVKSLARASWLIEIEAIAVIRL